MTIFSGNNVKYDTNHPYNLVGPYYLLERERAQPELLFLFQKFNHTTIYF